MKRGSYILGAIAILIAVTAAAPMAVYKVSKGSIQFRSDAPLELIKASSDELAGLFDSDKKMFAFRIKVNTFQRL